MKKLFVLGILSSVFVGELVWSAEKKEVNTGESQKSVAVISRESREKMALMHEKMAACLKSDKTINDCRSEMRGQCLATMGQEGCSFMESGNGMMGHSRMGKPRAFRQNLDSDKK